MQAATRARALLYLTTDLRVLLVRYCLLIKLICDELDGVRLNQGFGYIYSCCMFYDLSYVVSRTVVHTKSSLR
jgi:hypothetical protein